MSNISENDEQHRPKDAWVWLAADADDARAMHDSIALVHGDQGTIYECIGWREQNPVEAALRAAGFNGESKGAPVEITVEPIGDRHRLVFLRGFKVSPDKLSDVDAMIRMALRGDLGGFTPVLMAQVGFHRSFFAFEYAWAAAGKPAIHLRHPGMTLGGVGSGAPGSIVTPAIANTRLRASLARADELADLEPKG